MNSTNVTIIQKEMQVICNCDSKCAITEFEDKIFLQCQEHIKGDNGRRIVDELNIALRKNKKELNAFSYTKGVIVIS